MSDDRKVPKTKYIIDEESIDKESLDHKEEKKKLSQEEIEERIKKSQELKKRRKEKAIQAKDHKEYLKVQVKRKIFKILKKGKVVSKRSLNHLLINAGINDYFYRFNLIQNQIQAEIPNIGPILKELRFSRKIWFSVEDGQHTYYLKKNQKKIKDKKHKIDFDWKRHSIPDGKNEIYVAFKIPGSNTSSQHLLASCFPSARISEFKITVDKKYETSRKFSIFANKLDGYFEEDKLILRCKTSETETDKTLYTMVQIGRKIVIELLHHNFRYSEMMKINNLNNTIFIPVVPVFRAVEKQAFYETKFTNVLRIIYDFPNEFKSKLVYGKYSLLSKEMKDELFDFKEFYGFIEQSFEYQVKSFLTNAIMKDWIINPTKALNYMKEDEDLRKLIKEYAQDIETDRIIQERLEETMEKGEFMKELTTNLLLTLLGLSILAVWPPFQYAIIGFFVVINVYFFISWRKKKKRTVF